MGHISGRVFNKSDVGFYWPGAIGMGTSTSVLQPSFLELLCMRFAGRQVNLQIVSEGSTCTFGNRNYWKKIFDVERGDPGLLSCLVI